LIHTDDEIALAASQMAAYALEKGEPIFSLLSNLDQALNILSGDDQRSRSYSGPDEARAKRAIALAFLSHGELAAGQLAKAKLARLKGEGRSEVAKWMDRFFLTAGKNGEAKSGLA